MNCLLGAGHARARETFGSSGMNGLIGKLEEVPLRELWKHEERGFSAWLAGNLQELGNQLGLVLQNLERETAAGDLSVAAVASLFGIPRAAKMRARNYPIGSLY